MRSLTAQQKKNLIDVAKKSYLSASEVRKFNDSFVEYENSLHPLNESCYNISSLIYHIVKDQYGISDEDNKVYHCLIKFGEGTNEHVYSHFINKVYGEYIDASIEQFNNKISGFIFSPYENYKQYYKNIEEKAPLNINGIREEFEAYERFHFNHQFLNLNRDKKRSLFNKIINKILINGKGI